MAAFASTALPHDVRIEGTVVQHSGEDVSGTFVYELTADGRSKLQLNLGAQAVTENTTGYSDALACTWSEGGGAPHKVPPHNCVVPGSWMLPLLAMNSGQAALSFSSDSARSLTVSRKSDTDNPDFDSLVPTWSKATIMLDDASLPSTLSFNVRPDSDFNADLPVEISYSDYHDVDGIKVPYSVSKSVNGSALLDFTVTSVQFNTGTEAR